MSEYEQFVKLWEAGVGEDAIYYRLGITEATLDRYTVRYFREGMGPVVTLDGIADMGPLVSENYDGCRGLPA